MWLSTPQSSAVSVSSTLFKWILWKSRFANHSFNIYTSGGGTGSCNWNMASDICEANDFGLSARRVPEKIYLYPVDKNRQTTSQLWIHSGTCKRSLIAKLLKFTFKLLKYVFESYLLIYIDDWFCCTHSTEEQARVSCSNLLASSGFMRNSITAGGAFFPFIVYFMQFTLWIIVTLKHRLKCFKSDL